MYLQDLIHAFHLRAIAGSLRDALLFFAALFVVIYLLEARQGADQKRYLSRNFAVDVFYSLFYAGGLYGVWIYTPLFSALRPKLAVMDLSLLAAFQAPVAFAVALLVQDFLTYWMHRLRHTRFFWPFHSIHHSQERLTFLTSYRFHLVDQLLESTIMFVPLLLLGVPPKQGMTFYVLRRFLQAIQHSELNWRFGPMYRVLVSPVFHSVHHSTDPAHHDRNFGGFFSFWDLAFRHSRGQPAAGGPYGVRGMKMRESIVWQFAAPFRMLREAVVGKGERGVG